MDKIGITPLRLIAKPRVDLSVDKEDLIASNDAQHEAGKHRDTTWDGTVQVQALYHIVCLIRYYTPSLWLDMIDRSM